MILDLMWFSLLLNIAMEAILKYGDFHGYVSHNQMVTIMNQYFYEPLCYEPLLTTITRW
jgi:hypothetical protein